MAFEENDILADGLDCGELLFVFCLHIIMDVVEMG